MKTELIKKLFEEKVNEFDNRKELVANLSKALKAEFGREGDDEAVLNEIIKVIDTTLSKMEKPEIKLDVSEEDLTAAINEIKPDVTPIPEALSRFFEDPNAPKEEEVASVVEAIEADTLIKTVEKVNVVLADKGVKVDAESLANAKKFMNPTMYEAAIAGDTAAVDVLTKFIPAQAPEEKEPEKIDILSLAKPEEIAIKTPEEEHQATLSEIETFTEQYKAELIANGETDESVIAAKTNSYKVNLVNEYKNIKGQ